MRSKTLYRGFVTVKKVNGRDVVQKPDSVGFLFADLKNKAVLFVSQSREPMIRRSNPKGMIVEVPAGTRDRATTIKQLVVDEALEETGMVISPKQVKLLNRGIPLAASPGFLTERLYLAYVEMDLTAVIANPSGTFGLEEHGERITRVTVSFSYLERMPFADMKTFALVQWFLKEQLRKKGRK